MIPHICHQEIFAAMEAIKGIKLLVPWLRAKWHSLRGCSHDNDSIKFIDLEICSSSGVKLIRVHKEKQKLKGN